MSADLGADFYTLPLLDEGGSLAQLGIDDLTGLANVRADYGFDGSGQTVVIIDSGIAYDHAALGGGFGAGFTVVGGWDFAERDANPYDDGPYGSHGTHVAGIIASADSRALGLAPGVDLVALRVFDDSGNGNFAWVEQALQWVHRNRNAFANPITTVNLSLGAGWNSASVPLWATLEDEFAQLETAGIFTAVAAGNGFATTRSVGLDYPAASGHVVAVASVDADGSLSSFSQRLDRVIAAPGRSILSTVPDYVGNRDGQTNDFARYSGTSMASPYVAGAAVLVRQAMQFVGQAAIDQDAIYEVLRRTADSVYDPVTRQSYARLNLQRAIDSVMPADDYGSPEAAHRLGALGGARSLAGVISSKSDVDAFTFRAEATGTVTLQVDPREWLAPQLALLGGGGTTSTDGRTLTFSVVAGQDYTVALSTGAGLGHYELRLALAPSAPRPPVHWGVFKFETRNDVRLEGPLQTFAFRADSSGFVSIVGRYAASGGAVRFELFDAAGNRLATGSSAPGVERVDAVVRQGEVYTLHVAGANADVDFTLVNQLSVFGGVARISGSDARDVVDVRISDTGYRLTVNGVEYELARTEFARLQFEGQGGVDTLQVTAARSDDRVTLTEGRLELVGQGYRIEAVRVERIAIDGGGGADQAILAGTEGADSFYARPGQTDLFAGSLHLTLGGFRDVTFDARGGADFASLTDTPGDDTFRARVGEAQLRGHNYHVFVRAVETVQVFATGGFDTAVVRDSALDDSLVVDGVQARLISAVHDQLLSGFDRIEVQFGGGYDRAMFYDSAGDDRGEGRGNSWRWSTPYLDVTLFDVDALRAVSQRGGNDRATMDAVDYLFDFAGRWA